MKEKDSRILIKFGEQVAKLRNAKNLSLRELSARCNMDHADISRVEKGKLNISVTTLVDLARGLNMHQKKLLDFDVDE